MKNKGRITKTDSLEKKNGFFQYFLRLQRDKIIFRDVQESRPEIAAGKGRTLGLLKDLR